jgi:hypothetical protein
MLLMHLHMGRFCALRVAWEPSFDGGTLAFIMVLKATRHLLPPRMTHVVVMMMVGR